MRWVHLGIVVSGLALATAAAIGIVPGELGHHGAHVTTVTVPVPPGPSTQQVG